MAESRFAPDPGSGEDHGQEVRDVLLRTARQLGSAMEARWVLEHVLGQGTSAILLAQRAARLDPGALARLDRLVDRRLSGEPLQYVLGSWSFRGIELRVDPRVLIPRPETEVVVGHALDELGPALDLAAALGQSPHAEVLAVDLGTGSGAIAAALAVEGPARVGDRPLRVLAVDDAPDALEVAAANLQALGKRHPGAAPVELRQGDWFDALPGDLAGQVTLAVANPPYVAEAEWRALDPTVRDHEPRRALVGGPTGREAVDRILAQACRWLAPWGVLVVELAPSQAEDAALRALVDGFDAVVVRHDLAGRPRALIARRWGTTAEDPTDDEEEHRG
ncbi:peptide chain release factor N(5)-glutamine methyltransferase [Aciditerrimonas ferrireducens]|jgi:release factor glutamine methyltransferase|uniref:Peptide chain release factor N(5)-glutamine methyltransferase n=1 Tax=Aciditerrimonas ferrireducens TaxID=667306 RepID=A0ABV6C3L0_9ACTN|nr:peptide chain release factor N(5)-glutamine methyltransferase [Aciditerrimonas ferrireducens]MCK4176321.1 peptide chain release factor N(5)-glutamine methyltransferase [Aciditerrimonas ferrireducens]